MSKSPFSDASFLAQISIAESVTTLGAGAFSGCPKLVSVDFNSRITTLPRSLFNNCPSLTDFPIPDTITSIGDAAFQNCQGLLSITIPDTVTSLGNSPFFNCKSLERAFIGIGISSIPNGCFWDCENLKLIRFYGRVPSLGSGALSGISDEAIALIPHFESKGRTTFGGIKIERVAPVRIEDDELHVEINSPFARFMKLFHSNDLETWTEISDYRVRYSTFIMPPDSPSLSTRGNFFQGRLIRPN